MAGELFLKFLTHKYKKKSVSNKLFYTICSINLRLIHSKYHKWNTRNYKDIKSIDYWNREHKKFTYKSYIKYDRD